MPRFFVRETLQERSQRRERESHLAARLTRRWGEAAAQKLTGYRLHWWQLRQERLGVLLTRETTAEHSLWRLREALKAAASISPQQYESAAVVKARGLASTLLRVVDRIGILHIVATHHSGYSCTDGSLLFLAARTRSTDLVLTLARAGARMLPPGRELLQLAYCEDVYAALLSSAAPPMDASGAPLDDAGLAAILLELHAAGVRYPDRTALPPGHVGRVSRATVAAASSGRTQCLRVMLDGLDPHADRPDERGHTLLQIAARYCNLEACELLLQRGCDARTALRAGLCSVVDPEHLHRKINTLELLLTACGKGDLGAAARTSGACEDSVTQRPPAESIYCLCDVLFLTTTNARLLMYVTAAVGALPALPTRLSLVSWLMSCYVNAAESHAALMRTLRMDEHVGTAYVPDALRAARDVTLGVRLALCVDKLQQQAPAHVQTTRDRKAHVQMLLAAVVSTSDTLRSWAWMRRVHALRHRHVVLAQRR